MKKVGKKHTKKKAAVPRNIKPRKPTAKASFDELHDYVFQRVRVSDGPGIRKLVGSSRKSAEAFITLKTIAAIQLYYDKSLEVTHYVFHKSWNKNVLYVSLMTRPNKNHPVVAFANLDEPYIYMVRPFGKDSGQVSLTLFEKLLAHPLTTSEYYGLYLLFTESTRLRKIELIFDDRYSLLKCSNIRPCVAKLKEISQDPKLKTQAARQVAAAKWQAFYEKQSVKMIDIYFELLGEREYDIALAFLKSKGMKKYADTPRLDIFFISSKDIIGHLQIFISIYRIIHTLVDHLKGTTIA